MDLNSCVIMVRFQVHLHLVNCPRQALQFLKLNQSRVSNDNMEHMLIYLVAMTLSQVTSIISWYCLAIVRVL